MGKEDRATSIWSIKLLASHTNTVGATTLVQLVGVIKDNISYLYDVEACTAGFGYKFH